MRYATVCSGIEAPSQGWHGLGWEPVWFSEIERFPCAVLNHYYPDVPNLGDMTKIHEDERYQKSSGTIDVFCGGTPCQSFSVAGLRKGMADPRGNLALHFLRIADEIRPRWIVWENVPGVLSSNGGRDFGSFLAALGQLGYGFAYRVLDAQYFGVPQRRRRVFVVGHIGGWRGAAAVLFDTESLSGNPAPGREAGEEVTGTISSQSSAGGGLGTDFECDGGVVSTPIYSIKGAAIGRKPENGPQYSEVLEDGSCYTLNCTEIHAASYGNTVRRLTPIECERLQGFPDNFTRIPYRGKPASSCPAGPRYKALGNSMAVPVMRWIGERIQKYEELSL